MQYKGTAHKVGEHIDTDAIIPARFLVTTDAKKLGENCMAGLEPDWVRRVAPATSWWPGATSAGLLAGASPHRHPGAGILWWWGKLCRIFLPNAFNMGFCAGRWRRT
jgi:3-isopropylmalate/(R)-2-methylmalate dehydratase small subunit